MAFQFTCPYCFKKTLVDESLAGQSGPCVGCGKTVEIPAVSEIASEELSTESVRQSRARRIAVGWAIKVLTLCAATAAMSIMFFYVLQPALAELKIRRDRTACMNNLQRIAVALNSYAAEHGSYPPPVVRDANGKPMHSWRVLILKQLGEIALYNRYDFDQPWDSAENSRLFGSACPDVYVCPVVSNARTIGDTNYFLVTGKGTLFPPSGPLAPGQVTDNLRSTLLVVESDQTLVEWTNPIDIDVGRLNPQIGSNGSNTIGGNHPSGATIAFADGSAGWLPSDLSPELLNALITAQGGEPVDASAYATP